MTNSDTHANVFDWRANKIATNQRYDAWVDVLNRTYGSWDMPVNRHRDYYASLTTKIFGDFSITDCTCDPCAGTRAPVNISRDSREVLAIQLTLDGLEHIRFGDDQYVLEGGDIIVWDNTQRMTFEVQEKLHKISVILPLQRLKNWMPNKWHSIPRKISATSPKGALLTSYVMSLMENDFGNSGADGDALSEAAIALLACALDHRALDCSASIKESQLQRIKYFVEQNLDNPKLTLKAIALANKISLRYLHWLFESTNKTASQYILEQRLARCRRDLMNPLMLDRTIGSIALSWGFNDPTHFSRCFKRVYGKSPRELRSKALNG
ncbi:MAG: helix-turn-helix domain-containing protein [Pseudomonadota bacterium]